MSFPATPRSKTTVVAEPAWEWVLVLTGFPLLGAGAGWLLSFAADRISRSPVLPMGWVLKLLQNAPQPQTTIAALLAGALAGLALAVIGWLERLAVEVSPEAVILRRGRQARTVSRAKISGAFAEGKDLVLLGVDGGEAARESSALSTEQLHQALAAHGYRWHPDGDPYAGDFARWVEGLPGLPAGADALLRARQAALEKADSSDMAALRQELARVGVVVREEGKRQFWRPTTPPR